MRIDTNADKIAQSWAKRAAAIEPEMKKATEEATRVIFVESRKNLTEMIYNKGVPTKSQISAEQGLVVKRGGEYVPARWAMIKGKRLLVPLRKDEAKQKAWKRTGNLRRSERKYIKSAYEGIISNDANYAAARHEMKKTRFPAKWRESAVNSTRTKVRKIYRDAIKAAIMTGKLPGIGAR